MYKILPIFSLFLALIINAKEQNKALNIYTGCGMNTKAVQLAQLLIETQNQQRMTLVCNQGLAQAANEKAKIMARSEKVLHNLNNTSPNELLKNHGIILPLYYAKIGNQVESVLGGMQSAQETYDLFMTSKEHKNHLLGENEFYQGQTQIGVGYYFDKKTKHMDYWVVYITALKNNTEEYHLGMNTKPNILKFKMAKKKKRLQMPNSRHW